MYTVKFYYCTEWENPILHCRSVSTGSCAAPAGNQTCIGEHFEDVHLQTPSVARLRDFQVATFCTAGDVEFVICSKDKKYWDNPPTDYGSQNYFIKLSQLPDTYQCPDTIEDVNIENIISPFENNPNATVTSNTSRKSNNKVTDSSTTYTKIKETKISSHTSSVERSKSDNTIVVALINGKVVFVNGADYKKCLIVSDIDGTLVGNRDSLKEFTINWLTKHALRGSHLVYNTGRSLKDFLTVSLDENLPRPSFAIVGVGTEMYDFPGYANESHTIVSTLTNSKLVDFENNPLDIAKQDDGIRFPTWCPSRPHARCIPKFREIISPYFDRSATEKEVISLFSDYKINGNIFHDPYRLSVLIKLTELENFQYKPTYTTPKKNHRNTKDPCSKNKLSTESLKDSYVDDGDDLVAESDCEIDATQGPMEKLIQTFSHYTLCISGDGEYRYLDFLPPFGGKLGATMFIMNAVKLPTSQCIVCGDSGNDITMFSFPSINGICVGNATSDLVSFLEKVPDIFHGFEKKKSNISIIDDFSDDILPSGANAIYVKDSAISHSPNRMSPSELKKANSMFSSAGFEIASLLQGFIPTQNIYFAKTQFAAGIVEGLTNMGYF